MKQLFFTFILIYISFNTNAQVAINASGSNPSASSMLDVSSTTKGMLMPRMTTAQRKAITNPEIALLVFDTDRQTIYFFDGEKWKPMMVATEATAPLASREVTGAREFSGFGYAADIHGSYAVVGAPSDSAKGVNGGAVYIFEKNGGVWTQSAKLSAPTPVVGDGFGKAVSISDDYLVVGAPDKTVSGMAGRGAVYVFKRISRIWSYMTMLTASNGAANDNFGSAVSVYENYFAAGAPYRDHNSKANPGSVYVFGLQNNAWTQKAIVNASDPFAEARFGTSLDLWQSKLVIGAPAAEAVGFSTTNGGAVYVYNNTDANGFTWQFAQKLTAFGYTHNNMKFGTSVALEANNLVIGAPDYSGSGGSDLNPGLGCIFRFAFENGSWAYKNLLLEYGEFHKTGTSVALSGNVFLAGMPGSNNFAGKVMVNEVPFRFVYDEDPHLKHKFGTVVAAYNGQFLVTAPHSSRHGRVFFGVIE